LLIGLTHDQQAYADGILPLCDDVILKPLHRGELVVRVGALLTARRHRVLAERGDEMLSLVVHDLKNPISTMMVNANLLSAARELPESLRESSQDIADAAKAMNRMVTNLVELGRSGQHAALAPRWSRVDLTALAGTVCAA